MAIIKNISINIPPAINIIIFKSDAYKNNLNLFMYNNNKKIIMSFNREKFSLDSETNSLIIKKNYLNYEEKKTLNKFHDFLKS